VRLETVGGQSSPGLQRNRGRGVISKDARLSAFVKGQLCLDTALEADVEIRSISEHEVDLWTTVAILEDRDLSHDLGNKFFAFHHRYPPVG